MSGGILRFPWTSQPQIPVGIDWNNPLTRELLFSTSLAAGTRYKSQGRDGRIGTVNTKVDSGATKYGTAAKFDGTGYLDFGGTPIIGSTTPITITLYEETIATGGFASLLSFPVGSQNFLWIRGATGSYWCALGPSNSSPQDFSSVGVQTAGEKIRFVVRNLNGAGSASGWELWANGVKQTSGTTAFGSTAAGSVKIGWDGFDTKFNGLISDVNIIGRAWSDGEIKEYFRNPYQIHQPIQRTIWVPAAGGGAYTLTADSGSFALTGQDSGLAFNRVLAADTQSFALTGQTTGLAFNRTLAADSGSFALTGQDAGLAFNRVLSAANGSYALDGQDATLTYTPISGATYTLVAASGSFALTGQDTGLAFNRVLTADTQSYSLSGQTAGLAFNRVLTADTVSYALTGQDVTLTYTTNGFTYTLTAESGAFEVTGQDASLQHTTTASAGGGGWLPQTRRKSRKQIYEERVKLGILPPPVIKAAAKVAAVAQTVEEFKEDRPKYEEMFLKAIKKTEWLPDYTRAIQAQLAIIELEEEELLLLL